MIGELLVIMDDNAGGLMLLMMGRRVRLISGVISC